MSISATEEEYSPQVENRGISTHSDGPLSSSAHEAILNIPEFEHKWKVPIAFTPLIGRDQEIATICALLNRHDVRLLTLVGVGGIGKTRLSFQIVSEMREYFVDGACFVHLAAISDPEFVIPTIAQELGIQELRAHSIFEQVKVALRDKHFLLLLDNFEQLVRAVPQIEELLEACFHLKIVATSRVVLHARGEQVFPLSPLSLPDLTQADFFEHSSAMALFIQCSQRISPTFQATPSDKKAIAEICVRLDGLPLAIELAAARINLLPPKALLSRLSQRLQLLTRGLRSFPARHQTLRSALKWSYDLLDSQEQQLFRQLSIFVGGWSLEAAEAVCFGKLRANDEVDSRSLIVLDKVASLLDKSMLIPIEQGGSEEPRFMMLETIREFALEALHESKEAEIILHAHAMYYLRLVETAELHLKGPEQISWLEQLEHEHENLRAALGWLVEQKEAEQALRFCNALWWYWRLRGYWSEGRRWLKAALELVKAGQVTETSTKALCAAGDLAYYQDDYTMAHSLLEEAVVLCRSLGLEKELASALCTLGATLHAQGETQAALLMLQESLKLCRVLNNSWQLAYVLRQSGLIAWHQGNMEQALANTQEALTLARELGDKSLITRILSNLGGIAMRQGDLTKAATLAREGLVNAQELGDKSDIANTLQNLGHILSLQGDLEQAAKITQEGLLLLRELGDRTYITIALHSLGYLTSLKGDLKQATAYYREGLFLAQEIENKTQMGWHLVGLASIAATDRQLIKAARLYGAIDMRLDVKVAMNNIELVEYERGMQSVRSQLGERSFVAAFAEGQIMTLEHILTTQEPESLFENTPGKLQARSTAKTPPINTAGLTTREVEILRLVAQGLTDAQVAEQLVISPRTVNWHLTTIYSKLQVSSRSAATRYAIEHRLI